MPSRTTSLSRIAAGAYAATLRLLPLLYFVWAAVVGPIVAYVTPPWQNADEATQVLRAVEIAHGEFFGRRLTPHSAGGLSDPAVMTSESFVRALIGGPGVRVTAAMLRGAKAARWGALSRVGFDNTASYPPFLYAITAVAAGVGRLSHMRVVTTLHLMRILNCLAAASLGSAALALARRTRLVLAAMLVLPMTLALAASPAQDALLIPLAACAVAAVDRARSEPGRSPPLRLELIAAAAALLLILGRPPYLPLALLLLGFPGPGTRRRLGLIAGIGAAAVAWSIYVVLRVSVPLQGATPALQAAFLLHHPLAFPGILIRTWRFGWGDLSAQFVGVLGWLDAPIPGHFVNWAKRVLYLALAAAAIPDAVTAPGWWRSRTSIGVCALAGGVAAVCLALYVVWTVPGGAAVDGLQGRYFLPLFPLLAFAMPNCGRWAAALRPPALLAVLLLAVAAPAVTVVTLVDRYYLQP